MQLSNPLLVVSALFLFVLILAPAQSRADGRPIKIKIDAVEHLEVGKTTRIVVTLLDAKNNPTPTPENIYLSINVHWPSGKIDAFIVPIAQGSATGEFPVLMKKPGVCQIDVSEAHLLEGNTFILGTPTPAPAASQEAASQKVKTRALRMPRMATFRGVGDEAMVSVGVATQTDLNSGAASQVQFCAPTRSVLADEHDSAEIRVFLVGSDGLESDAKLNLFASMGSLAPNVLTIPKGSISATVKIASNDTGTAYVQMPSSKPLMMPIGSMPVVHFVHAITGIQCAASPPNISLIDNTQIVVRLVNEKGNPAPSDSGQEVTLTIDNGRGELAQSVLRIPPGSYECRTAFIPTTIGAISISGSTEGLPIEHVDMQVMWPIMQLLFSVAGGLAGGMIAKIMKKHQPWRVAIGVVTGVVLYWAFIFGLLNVVPKAIALNPISAFAISVLGGWLGTQVFSSLLSQFGLAKKATAA